MTTISISEVPPQINCNRNPNFNNSPADGGHVDGQGVGTVTPSVGRLVRPSHSDNLQPPYTNRGVGDSHNPHTVFSFDWLSLTFFGCLDAVMPLLTLLNLSELEEVGHGGIGFRRILSGANGFQVYLDPVSTEPGQTFVSLRFPGRCLKALGMEKFSEAFDWLSQEGQQGSRWEVTRLDLANDTQEFGVQAFVDAYFEGKVICKARRYNEYRSSGEGHTFYLGSRESTAMLRVYHKMDGDSFGEQPFTRVELELKGERATDAFIRICTWKIEQWASEAAKLLNGFIQVETDWWADWVGRLGRAWLALKRNAPTIQKMRNWLYSQVAPSLVTVLQALSSGECDRLNSEIQAIVQYGQKHQKKHHKRLVEAYQPDTALSFLVPA